ncbi:MAG: LETM1-related biofilm-associated protein [Flavobacterium sp.]
MINPSAPGWIDKYFLDEKVVTAPKGDAVDFYVALRHSGFIYGHIVSISTQEKLPLHNWLSDEISKLALLHALVGVYQMSCPQGNPTEFISKAVDYYDQMHPQGFSWLPSVIPQSSLSSQLEKIIDERVQTNDNVISKNFSHIVTNALLFVDVLAFRYYLTAGEIPEKFVKKMEETLVSLVSLALKTKSNKSPHDDLLIKLFEASVRYTKLDKYSSSSLDALAFDYFTDPLAKYYLLDMAGLALWSDSQLYNEERFFLYQVAQQLNIDDAFVASSIVDTAEFIAQYKTEIPYFNYANPVKHFYDHSTQLVTTLIQRNKKRLAKEISESKELMVLLAHSTQRDLDKDEKKKVKKQLLDICKTVPSLTIFLIPGGSLLLPLLVKFIPQLLPSSFNENLGDE